MAEQCTGRRLKEKTSVLQIEKETETGLKILGHIYKVEVKTLQFTEGAQGFHYKNVPLLQVDSMLAKTLQEEVLLHEIIEAINYRLELKLEHTQITPLSEGLYQVLSDAGFLKIDFNKITGEANNAL